MEPALSFPAQEQAAQRKLEALRAKVGKLPNIVWLLIDDMVYGDPGAFGGGESIGAATPNMDRLARVGLKLTSTYSQPTCTDLVLNPERMEMLRKTGASGSLVHGFKGGKTQDVRKIDSIEAMGEADTDLKNFSVARIKELAAGGQPFFLEHAFMKVHADNFASKAFEGKSSSKYPYKDNVVEVDAYVGEIVRPPRTTTKARTEPGAAALCTPASCRETDVTVSAGDRIMGKETKNVVASVLARLHNNSKTSGAPFQQVLQQYAIGGSCIAYQSRSTRKASF